MGNSMNRLKKVGYCFRNIPRQDKIGGDTGIIYRDRYHPPLVKVDLSLLNSHSGRLK